MNKNKVAKKILMGGVVLTLLLSLCLNYVFYKADVEYWLAYRRIVKIEATPSPILNDINTFHEELTRGGYEFLKKEKRLELPQFTDVYLPNRFKKSMDFNDLPVMGVIETEHDAYVFLELLDDAIKNDDKDKIAYLKAYFDSHTLSLPYVIVPQAIAAMISIELYKYSKEEKYKEHARKMYDWLCSQNTEYGIIYISGMRVSLVDVIGVVVPFLSKFSEVFDCKDAYSLALQQIEIYTHYGCDKETGIPAAGYSLESQHIKIGRINWGRGLSWYLIGLSYVDSHDLSEECQNCIEKLNGILTGIWQSRHSFGQFIADYDNAIDMTADLPILYYLNKIHRITLTDEQILHYSQYMNDGIMYHCSNGNAGAIKYGVAHGPLMLAQAFMMRLTKEVK